MNVPLWVWLVTIAGFVLVIGFDLIVNDHKPHAVTLGEVTRWVVFYVALAVAFGIGVWLVAGGDYAGQFFAGYLTEYSLSVDNLFVFLIIMSAFKVPVIHQHRVLLVGIVIALIMRSIFIAAGAAVIDRFSWVFYLFAVFLIYTAISLVRQAAGGDDEEWEEGRVLRLVRRVFPVTDDYHGARTTVRIDGKRWLTPMLIVMIAIGVTDVMFALDSIPAIFGLTQEAYLVFTANAFALMGLRQLYFLLGGLLNKLVFLSYGLAVLLAFIGVKLALHALHENELPFLNGGEPLPVPDIGIGVSLGVIIGVLALTTITSLVAVRLRPELAERGSGITAPPLARTREEADRLVAEDEKADHRVTAPRE
ncbi:MULTISPECIES: TerC family protein [Pseudonocardia]|uniref:Inner membrane protein alx n=2 Tax=Pseudonocardia TaxID=1847 RepID=A0A1Y2MSR6_PSEAH|nr:MULTISPECIES: TerC family protein [Pseudonocardia]OSY38255.1 Inner membrane protein alx [Pseudonocardia autotrophica]TDN71019.1 tellurite resistance protein TerC [Pseudonocardia autotrophica]BBG01687.1 tellurium resistance protein TerC [Pseudonocardia autotrophica]GEC25432.1 tellurium resistance protein TerC [Pseudonocardia saturnea]